MASSTSDQSRWQALVSRDRSSSKDIFVYAVRTTKIYCRPSCPSRLARRANIEFYDYSAQAEKAGYRACKRCKPDLKILSENHDDPMEENKMLDYAQHKKMVQKACQSIRENGGQKRLKDLSKEAGLTSSHFHRVFKKVTGVTPGEYGKRVREEGAFTGEDCAKMIDDALTWAEESPKNLEAMSDISSKISKREKEARTSPRHTQSDGLNTEENGSTETTFDFLDLSNFDDHQMLEASDLNNAFLVPDLAFNDLSRTTTAMTKASPDFGLNTMSMPPESLDKITGIYNQDLSDYLLPTLIEMSAFHELSDFRTPPNPDEVGVGRFFESTLELHGFADRLPFSQDGISGWP